MTGAPQPSRFRSEQGAIVVVVAVALLVFTMASALVIDYGVLLVSRGQAQNAADSAALAGATALAYDGYSDRTAAGPAQIAANSVAAENHVWGDEASIDIDAEVVCADSNIPGQSWSARIACVQVTASRDEEHENPLPTLIAGLMGVETTNISATAIAEAKDANATDCLKPLAIPDRWLERYPVAATWSAASTYDKYGSTPPHDPLVGGGDSYLMPDDASPRTGMTMNDQFGMQVTLSFGSVSTPVTTIQSWQYLPVQIPGSTQAGGADDVLNNTKFCAASKVTVRTRLTFATGPIASRAGDIASGLNYLVGRDPGAHWDTATQRVVGSCADLGAGRCASMSPRIIAVALYSPNDLAVASHPPSPGATSVLATNIIGFFVDSVSGTDVTGHIMRHPGLIDPDVITLYDNSAFLRASMLVQ